MNHNQSRICYRQFDDNGGGDGEDPRDNDERLVNRFKTALSYQRHSYSTNPDPYKLISAVIEICERMQKYPHIPLDQDLRPIAYRLKRIEPRNRETAGVVVDAFNDFEL